MLSKILSCFIDEAGDFGEYRPHSPYYIVSVILHEQSNLIKDQIDNLEMRLSEFGFSGHEFHTGPLIRREGKYKYIIMEKRKKLFNLLFRFTRLLPITFFSANVKKSECVDSNTLYHKLTKAISDELIKRKDYFNQFDKIIIYYDNGQKSLTSILNTVFNCQFTNIEVREIHPIDYRLFQVADLICTLEHIHSKIEDKCFSNSELEFFSTAHDFKKQYWNKIIQQLK